MVSRLTSVRHGCRPVKPLPMRSRIFAIPSFVIFPCSYAMVSTPSADTVQANVCWLASDAPLRQPGAVATCPLPTANAILPP